MASITMAALPSGIVVADRASPKRGKLLVTKATASRSTEGEKVQLNCNNAAVMKSNEMVNNGRREMMFVAAAAAACSIAGAAFAEDLKAGTPEAKKFYAPICVTMPTARICHK
ncbi:hypothetical protein Sjap_002360 [Stephania japonica]|uniref:Photosystem II 5 kDa protein, chloroplastic n=1 Tax=Stephania japonica TaxID=461633 RepID=A0AAP0KMN6_9MAGN